MNVVQLPPLHRSTRKPLSSPEVSVHAKRTWLFDTTVPVSPDGAEGAAGGGSAGPSC